jgi:D-inositol-3-phosphate glycosyltransferase
MKVALLTGGKDLPYARGLVRELAARGVRLAVVGDDELAGCEEVRGGRVEFHDLVGRLEPRASVSVKAWRVLRYYARLFLFAARTDARLFHILWFRKFPVAERILFAPIFKLLGKRLVFTAHNVDDRARNSGRTTLLNRLSLSVLYRAADRILVHTPRMRRELVEEFRVAENSVTVVPFGINDVIPVSTVPREEARRRCGLDPQDRVLLFFGNLAPYKGLEVLVRALAELVPEDDRVALVVAGAVKDPSCEPYWRGVQGLIGDLGLEKRVRALIGYVPDREVGLLFRAADVAMLPYLRVDQSGVLALSYAQGLPVIAADVGSMRDDVLEGETGFLHRAGDVVDLAGRIRTYFASALYRDLEMRRRKISDFGAERFSWATNADRTHAVYESLLRG